MNKILVSACLLGKNCKYNGLNNYNQKVVNYLKDKDYIMICPEVMGGLSIPRVPSEIRENKVINKNGLDVTKEYAEGALKTLEIVRKYNIKKALLKARSPSCGSNYIYDGTFNNILINGNGVTTSLLKENGVEVITENDIK